MKRCTKCRVKKPDSEFYSYRRGSVCKSCVSAQVCARQQERYRSDPEYRAARLAYGRGRSEYWAGWYARKRERYRSDPEFRESVLAANRSYDQTSESRIKRKVRTLRKYGVDLAQFERMVVDQDGCCAICGVLDDLVVDHDHRTGRVRQLLCKSCNLGLGHFWDDPELLERAAAYLVGHFRRWDADDAAA